MSSLQPVRGTHDILPEESRRHRHVVDIARRVSERYGYGEISTPIFEFTEVFARTLGETSDIVTKEMYTFQDRGGDGITLRPEGTAGIARAFISGGLAQELPLKFFYTGPMFRYERPQKGRLRQFHQFGVELLGVATPQADIEVIALAAQALQEIGALGKTKLEINTLGDKESREAYRNGSGRLPFPTQSRPCRRTARTGCREIRCEFSIRRTKATGRSSRTRRCFPIT